MWWHLGQSTGAGGSTLKMAYSRGWQVAISFGLGAQLAQYLSMGLLELPPHSMGAGCQAPTVQRTGIGSYQFIKAWAPKLAHHHFCHILLSSTESSQVQKRIFLMGKVLESVAMFKLPRPFIIDSDKHISLISRSVKILYLNSKWMLSLAPVFKSPRVKITHDHLYE